MKTELLEKIDEYIQGNIDYSQLEAFANSTGVVDLKEKIEWFRTTQTAIEANAVRDQLTALLSEDKERKNQHREAKVIKMAPTRWIIGIAASALILMVSYWGIMDHSKSDPSYAAFDFVDPGIPVFMGETENYKLFDALSYYGEENYTMTIEKLEALQESGVTSDTIRYYLGASHLYNKAYNEAEEYLSAVAANKSSGFYQRAEWLLVVGALKQENITAVSSRLEPIIKDSTHTFYQKGIELNQSLQSH